MSKKVENTSTEEAEVVEQETVVEEVVEEVESIEPSESLKPTNEDDDEERLQMARELDISLRRDPVTRKPIIPSTPAMRAALARKALNNKTPIQTSNIEALVIDTYGETVAADPNIKMIISVMTEYLKRMGPNSTIDEKRGGELQASLANLYDVVLSLPPELAEIGLETIVTIIKQNIRGAFKQTLALRFANTMPLNKELSLRFQLLTTLFISLASGIKKKDLAKTINIRQLHEYVSDRTAKANLSEFIN